MNEMKAEEKKIRMRGHHLFCISVMQNWTLWGPRFWENVKKYKALLDDDDVKIEIARYCCDTCASCPCIVDGKCELYDFREGGNRIDLEILGQLGLKIGDEITAGELRRKLKANFKNMPSICDWGCGVTDSGCDEGLRKLRGGD
jgi:hypothetical protein